MKNLSDLLDAHQKMFAVCVREVRGEHTQHYRNGSGFTHREAMYRLPRPGEIPTHLLPVGYAIGEWFDESVGWDGGLHPGNYGPCGERPFPLIVAAAEWERDAKIARKLVKESMDSEDWLRRHLGLRSPLRIYQDRGPAWVQIAEALLPRRHKPVVDIYGATVDVWDDPKTAEERAEWYETQIMAAMESGDERWGANILEGVK